MSTPAINKARGMVPSPRTRCSMDHHVWLATHGDPSPEKIAGNAIAALASYLAGQRAAFSFEQVWEWFAKLGLEFTRKEPKHVESLSVGDFRRPPMYCFKFKGERICTELPSAHGPQHFE